MKSIEARLCAMLYITLLVIGCKPVANDATQSSAMGSDDDDIHPLTDAFFVDNRMGSSVTCIQRYIDLNGEYFLEGVYNKDGSVHDGPHFVSVHGFYLEKIDDGDEVYLKEHFCGTTTLLKFTRAQAAQLESYYQESLGPKSSQIVGSRKVRLKVNSELIRAFNRPAFLVTDLELVGDYDQGRDNHMTVRRISEDYPRFWGSSDWKPSYEISGLVDDKIILTCPKGCDNDASIKFGRYNKKFERERMQKEICHKLASIYSKTKSHSIHAQKNRATISFDLDSGSIVLNDGDKSVPPRQCN